MVVLWGIFSLFPLGWASDAASSPEREVETPQNSEQGDSDFPLWVDEIRLVGLKLTEPRFVRQEMSIRENGWATEEMVENDRLKLLSLGIFNYVEIRGRREAGKGVVVVKVNEEFYLYPVPIVNKMFWKEDERVYGLTLIHQNFRGYGEKLVVSWWEGKERGFSFSHQDPWFSIGGKIGIRLSGSMETGYANHPLTNEEVKIKTERALIRLKRRIKGKSWFGFQTTWMDLSTPSPNYTLTARRRDRTFTGSLLGVWDSRDYLYYPRKGYFFQLAMEQIRWVDTSYTYFQPQADLRAYFPLRRGIGAAKVWATLQDRQTPLYRQITFPMGTIRNQQGNRWRGDRAIALALEYRFTLVSMFYVSLPSLPWIGEYTESLPFGVEGFIFLDQGNLWGKKGKSVHRSWALGGGFHFRVPYLEIISASLGWGPTNRPRHPTLFITNRVTF